MALLVTETRVATATMTQAGDFELREVRDFDPDRFPMVELIYREGGKPDVKISMTISEAQQIMTAMGPLLDGMMERYNERGSYRK